MHAESFIYSKVIYIKKKNGGFCSKSMEKLSRASFTLTSLEERVNKHGILKQQSD